MRQLESFFWGIIAALGALFVELVIFIAFTSYDSAAANLTFSGLYLLPQFVILGAATEEMFKYLIIAKRVDIYSFQRSYIVNSLLVGLGFAATEFGLQLSSGAALPSVQILSEIAILHLGTCGLLGYLVATRNPKKISTILWAVFLTTFLHSAYNLLIQKRDYAENYLIYLLLAFLLAINLFNLLRINARLASSEI